EEGKSTVLIRIGAPRAAVCANTRAAAEQFDARRSMDAKRATERVVSDSCGAAGSARRSLTYQLVSLNSSKRRLRMSMLKQWTKGMICLIKSPVATCTRSLPRRGVEGRVSHSAVVLVAVLAALLVSLSPARNIVGLGAAQGDPPNATTHSTTIAL